MFAMPSFKAAVAHAAPVYLDPAATVDKACAIIAEAARNGARIVAFPESYLPGFPVWAALFRPIETHDLFARFAAASVRADGPEIAAIRQAARAHGILVSLGFSEANPVSIGGLWNSNILIDETGAVLVHHRKLVATFFEKLVWAPGDGAGLRVADTSVGRVGALICGENTNPLARFALMAEAEQVHISSYPPVWPTRPPEDAGNYDNRGANLIRAAGHAFEAKVFGLVSAGCLDDNAKRIIANGSSEAAEMLEKCPAAPSFFVDPTGKCIGDELTEEGIGYAEIDLSGAVEPKRFHDVSAGYNRFDVFDLRVDRTRHSPATFTEMDAPGPADLPDPGGVAEE
ncbi:carbon-nitrogen hydrolase family protein [Roseivivax sp. THAF197b]|uniref:carbon-nitrogen hydrolase family protein n=1 Tax=Roseivivax sp. THAF197b TaxID=2588299 RepID=UPI0012AA7CF5|nr:carbon-nitrogen hydrolase family protein [Roseivivax sp. THAF197b]QFS83547.1 Nitrilase, bromoxynil-specific [Roseivivax sp. THAF197b]